MRTVLQRVKSARVSINQETIGQIPHGFLLLMGITHDDNEKDADYLVEKILKLRLFENEERTTFMARNIQEVNGSILVVSQFTLYGDCSKGTRPDFGLAAKPEMAEKLYEYFVIKLREKNINVQTGKFREHMEVELVNDGPVTLILESKR